MGLLLLVFLKIDYRFIESFTCCQDDHDYFMHAETIALDFDLDYTNQLAGYEEKRFSSNGKIAPKGFIGTGIFSSIFLYVGNLFEINDLKDNIFNYKILFYSLSVNASENRIIFKIEENVFRQPAIPGNFLIRGAKT